MFETALILYYISGFMFFSKHVNPMFHDILMYIYMYYVISFTVPLKQWTYTHVFDVIPDGTYSFNLQKGTSEVECANNAASTLTKSSNKVTVSSPCIDTTDLTYGMDQHCIRSILYILYATNYSQSDMSIYYPYYGFAACSENCWVNSVTFLAPISTANRRTTSLTMYELDHWSNYYIPRYIYQILIMSMNKRPPGLIAPLLWHLLGNPPKYTTKGRDLLFNEGIRLLLNMADTSLDRFTWYEMIQIS